MRNRNLIEPIRGRSDADGALLSADPPLRALQLGAGGLEGGTIAVPELLSLCRSSMQLGMALARPIALSDEAHDYRLLVEIVPDDRGCSIVVAGWSERPRTQDEDIPQRFTLAEPSRPGGTEIQVDAGWRVIAVRSEAVPAGAVGEEATDLARPLRPPIGALLTEWLQPVPDGRGRIAMLDALGERQVFRDQSVRVADRVATLAGRPLLSANGEFAGYLCALVPQPPDDPAEDGSIGLAAFAPSLRSPLSRIMANARTIHGQLNGPIREQYVGYARDIASAAAHLLGLVEDYGEIENIEHADFAPQDERIDCADLARRAAGLLSVRAADRQMTLVAPAEGEMLSATGEFRRVLQILVNLVGNAVRYAPDGTTVTVAVDIGTDGRPTISVTDEGSGIDESDRERVFEKFERLGRAADGGSGLGLYISRRLARAMGGDLCIAPGGTGATGVTFVLSLRPASADRPGQGERG